jgi:hypothetical protein
MNQDNEWIFKFVKRNFKKGKMKRQTFNECKAILEGTKQ